MLFSRDVFKISQFFKIQGHVLILDFENCYQALYAAVCDGQPSVYRIILNQWNENLWLIF